MSLCLITGNVKSLLGMRNRRATFNSGTVKFKLIRQPRTTMKPVIAGSRLAAVLEYDFDVQYDGSFVAKVQSNDGIEPEKTFYEVSFLIPTVRHSPRFYRIIGPRVDLNSATQFQPVSADVWVDDL